MADLLNYLITTPIASVIPVAATPDPPSPAKRVGWTDPYHPIHGRSPLQYELGLPPASNSEVWSRSTHPSTPASSSAAVSSPPTTPTSSPYRGLGRGEEEEEEEDYDPDFATDLVARMMKKEEIKQRKENEEICRIRHVLGRKREEEGSLGEEVAEGLHCRIVRYLHGHETKHVFKMKL
jgi:hypothetical protein